MTYFNLYQTETIFQTDATIFRLFCICSYSLKYKKITLYSLRLLNFLINNLEFHP